MTVQRRKKVQPEAAGSLKPAIPELLYRCGDIDRNPGPRINDHPRVGDILQLGVTSSTAPRYTAKVQKFEQWLQVQRGLPELLETGLSSLVAVTVEYLRGAIASAALSSSEVGTLISGIRRFLLLAQAMEAGVQ